MKAVILCAGYGTRLGSLTDETPKTMLFLAGRPMLEYIICHLAGHGFREIAVNLHFMPEVIESYFKNCSDWDVELTYFHEPELLGTAGGIKKMEPFLEQDNFFLIHYGDVLTDQDFTEMLKYHQKKEAMATLLLHTRNKSNSIVEMDNSGRIRLFIERPIETERTGIKSPWINSGVYICSPDIFNHISDSGPSDLPRDVFSKVVADGKLFGYPLTGYRCAVDSPQRYKEAQEAIASGACRINIERK